MSPIETTDSEIRWWTVIPLRTGGAATLRVYDPLFSGYVERGVILMLTIEGLIAVISLCISCFSIGYVFGRNDKKQK